MWLWDSSVWRLTFSVPQVSVACWGVLWATWDVLLHQNCPAVWRFPHSYPAHTSCQNYRAVQRFLHYCPSCQNRQAVWKFPLFVLHTPADVKEKLHSSTEVSTPLPHTRTHARNARTHTRTHTCTHTHTYTPTESTNKKYIKTLKPSGTLTTSDVRVDFGRQTRGKVNKHQLPFDSAIKHKWRS